MSDDEINMRFFGWSQVEGADKVWGWFTVGKKIYNFWGKRGAGALKKLKFKQHGEITNLSYYWLSNLRGIEKLQRNKEDKGYKSVSVKIQNNSLVEIEKIYPGFTDHCFDEMVMAKLSDKIMTADD